MRRILRPSFSALLCAAFFAQSVGAADLAPMFARGMMLPPPGRMLPMPLPAKLAPAKPAGEPWLVSAKIVAGWVSERVEQSLTPAAETAPSATAAVGTELAISSLLHAATAAAR